MKKIEFHHELSDTAFDVYASSTFEFYLDADDTYYCSDIAGSEKYRIGSIEQVEEYLLMFA